jgi:hypothetical protein
MFENFTTTPDHRRMNSLEVAMHARTQDHKVAQMVARYRKNTGAANQGSTLRRIFNTLISSFH